MVERLLQKISQSDVLIVHGSGLHEFEIGPTGWWPGNPEAPLPKPDPDGRMRETALIQAWQMALKELYVKPIIVAGGNVFKDLAPSTGFIVKENLKRRGKIPDDSIYLAEGGNTVADMQEVERVMRENDWRTSIHISSGYHRVLETLCGIQGREFIPAEDLLEMRNKRYQKIVNALLVSQDRKNAIRAQERKAWIVRIPFIGEKIYDFLVKRKLSQGIKSTPFNRLALLEMVGKPKEPVVK